MKSVTLYRVRINSMGGLPTGFPDGMITGFTDQEFEIVKKNPHLRECFEEITIKPGVPYASEPNPKPSSETADATHESSLSAGGVALDGKT